MGSYPSSPYFTGTLGCPLSACRRRFASVLGYVFDVFAFAPTLARLPSAVAASSATVIPPVFLTIVHHFLPPLGLVCGCIGPAFPRLCPPLWFCCRLPLLRLCVLFLWPSADAGYSPAFCFFPPYFSPVFFSPLPRGFCSVFLSVFPPACVFARLVAPLSTFLTGPLHSSGFLLLLLARLHSLLLPLHSRFFHARQPFGPAFGPFSVPFSP